MFRENTLEFFPAGFYSYIYQNIIKSAIINSDSIVKDYNENHHIIPKCLGGLNTKCNLIKLTAKEHYLCHYLLCKIYPNNKKLIYAFNKMQYASSNQQRYTTSAGYELSKRNFSKLQRQQWLENNPMSYRDVSAKIIPCTVHLVMVVIIHFTAKPTPTKLNIEYL